MVNIFLSVQPKSDCVCDVNTMSPVRISFESNDKYSHICATCKKGITHDKNDRYNQYFGFSGYDEYPDESESREDD